MSGFQIWLSGDDLAAIETRQIEGVGEVALIDLEWALREALKGAVAGAGPDTIDQFHAILSAAIVKLDDHRKARKA